MDPLTLMAIGQIAGPLIGAGVGRMLSEEDRKKAEQLQMQALGLYDDLNMPEFQTQMPALPGQISAPELSAFERLQTPDLGTYQSAGMLQPQLQQALTLGPSAMQDVQVDPALAQAQMQALSQLRDIADSGGMTDVERAQMTQIQEQMGQQQRGARDALMRNMRRRGMSGSGLELAQQLQAQQQGAMMANRAGQDVAAMAQQRALQAMMQGGDLAGRLRAQQFGEQSAQAQAMDAISRFNLANRQQIQGSNVAARNAAQAQNLANAQQLANMNIGQRDREKMLGREGTQYANQLAQMMFNQGMQGAQFQSGQAQQGYQNRLGQTQMQNQLAQQQFGNQQTLADARARALSGQAQMAQNRANQTQATWSGVGQAAGQAATAYGMGQAGAQQRADDRAFQKELYGNVYGGMSGG